MAETTIQKGHIEEALSKYNFNISDDEVREAVRKIITEKVPENDTLEVKKFLETGRLSKIWCCVLVFSYSFSDKVCSLKQSNSNQRANTDL